MAVEGLRALIVGVAHEQIVVDPFEVTVQGHNELNQIQKTYF